MLSTAEEGRRYRICDILSIARQAYIRRGVIAFLVEGDNTEIPQSDRDREDNPCEEGQEGFQATLDASEPG